MDARSAKMTKSAANALLASRISFLNEIANLCEHIGSDIHWVRQGVGSDRRVGSIISNRKISFWVLNRYFPDIYRPRPEQRLDTSMLVDDMLRKSNFVSFLLLPFLASGLTFAQQEKEVPENLNN